MADVAVAEEVLKRLDGNFGLERLSANLGTGNAVNVSKVHDANKALMKRFAVNKLRFKTNFGLTTDPFVQVMSGCVATRIENNAFLARLVNQRES